MIRKRKKFSLISLRKKKRWRPKKRSYWKLIIIVFLLFTIIPSIIWYMWFKKHILNDLPNIANIEKVVFSQTTTITDRNWIVLYKLFNENRKYVPISKIATNMQNAIVATEDKTFWTNEWIDIQWIIRAWIKDVIFWKKQWWSTLTQQLIKNLLLTRQKTIIRKLKEIVLTLELNKFLTQKIKSQYKWLSNKEIKKKMKEKILEMYLNYVFFGNNAYGIQAAAQTYFHKDANTLTVLESAILAGIPKSPTEYDPVINRANNLWTLEILDASWNKISLNSSIGKKVEKAYIDYLKNKTFSFSKSENDIFDILTPKHMIYNNFKVKYIPGRKDFVLARMYIDWYIDKNQLIQAEQESFNKKIYKLNIQIKAPWFVFRVIKELEKKYWKDLIEKAGWTIKTSLDRNIQKLADQSVQARSGYLLKKWANNAALLYINSKNGDILAYVWSEDYYNKKIDGKVDMITSLRQCGSVIKPLIYSNAFIKNPTFTPETPIYDTKFNIAKKWESLNNFDDRFLWLMPIKKALPYSRNIPAVKMYFLGWWEYKVKSFLQSLWLKTISDKIYYGYPLAIWAADVRMIDMAQAFSNLSNINWARKINGILEIKWPNWNIIYKKQDQKLKQIIPVWVVSMIWDILSNPYNLPPTWRHEESIKWLKLANKSWTTNIIDKKNGKKYPRDGWFISYSPSKVFVVWAWNTKWKHMHSDAYGGWTAWKIWKTFVLKLKKNWYIHNEEMVQKWTTSIYVNTINGKESSELTPIQISKKTIARIDWIPPKDDGQTVKMIQIDTLCNWLVSKYTPKSEQKYAYVITGIHSHMPNNPKWEDPVQKWWKTVWILKYQKIFNAPVLLKAPTQICKSRLVIAKKWMLNFNIDYPKNNQTISYVFDLRIKTLNAPFKIKKIDIYLDNQLVQTSDYTQIVGVYLKNNITIWKHKLTIVLTDNKWYTKSQTININLVKKDTTYPYLDKIVKQNWKYIYIFKDKESRVLWWFLICNWKKQRFSWPIAVWNSNNCSYESVIDYYGNSK